MMISRPKIVSVVNFCSNDYRFFEECVKQLRYFSDTILVSVCDHFFNGEVENLSLLEHLYACYSDCTFIEFSYAQDALYGPSLFSALTPREEAHYWHNAARLCTYYFLPSEAEWVFFFDVDE